MTSPRRIKRFYRDVSVVEDGGGHVVLLDGKKLQTPKRVVAVFPTPALCQAVADEWCAQGEEIVPQEMRLCGLANAAIDRVGGDKDHFVRELCAYGDHDLICYHAEWPSALAERQFQQWLPWIDWIAKRYGISLNHGAGVGHVAQPDGLAARLAGVVTPMGRFHLTGIYALATALGSVTLALAVDDLALGAAEAFALSRLDEAFQANQWGSDGEAVATAQAVRLDVEAAARFLGLCGRH